MFFCDLVKFDVLASVKQIVGLQVSNKLTEDIYLLSDGDNNMSKARQIHMPLSERSVAK